MVVAAWTVMSMAMMLPVALPAIRHVALNSIRERRARAMTVFVATYIAVWALFGLVALLGVRAAVDVAGVGGRALLLAALAAAALWQAGGVKRRSLAQCRRTVPLPPVGRRADVACVRFAFLHGRRCVLSCWPLMVLMAVVEHGAVVWMIALAVVVSAEELTRVGRRLPGLSAVALTLTAAFLLLSG
ncbi:copper chaperone [Frankia sp. CiP1_Cm_nod2]|uniref:copper chaperone n=1 Tax=Frankia sp. CiP1_Cm_nod2 TaxID=2897161 RepID=UPI002023DF18